MKSFSNINDKFNRALYRAATFIMTFLLMFTAVVPEMSALGGVGRTADAATSDGNTYKVLGIMAEYSTSQWWSDRYNKWEPEIKKRLQNMLGNNINVSMNLIHSREFNCLNEELIDNYDYVVFIVNSKFSHVGTPRKYTESQMAMSGEQLYYDSKDKKWYYRSVTSGNDITAKKLKELKLFYDSGYPVEYMSLDHLKTTSGAEVYLGSSKSGDSNESNVAKLYEYTNGSSAQIDGTHDTDADNRIKNIRSERVDLQIISAPEDYTKGYANTGDETSKLLSYTFKITDGKADSLKRYTADFCIDMNNDGRFDEGLESLSYLGITLASNGKKNIESNALQANVEYRLTVNASKYVGLVCWKLTVSDNSDPEHRFSYKDGACKLHLMKGQSKEKLRIVQLTASPAPTQQSSQWTYNTVYLPTEEEAEWIKNNNITRDNIATKVSEAPEELFKTDKTAGENSHIYSNSIINKSPHAKSPDDSQDTAEKFRTRILQCMYDFYTYMYSDQRAEGVKDYDISVERVYVNNITTLVPGGVSDDEYQKLYQYLTDNYDMIILGFSDCYDDVDSVVCDAIQAFIAEGKSVLFTHDTSSFVNTRKNFANPPNQKNNNWGYNINQKMRNLLGMDRFGITLTESERKVQGKDYYNGSPKYIQGYADSTIEPSVDSADDSNSTGGENGKYATQSASRINIGPITEYPYMIGNVGSNGERTAELKIAQTHTQYYQLDLESDDIVVWYALNGISGGKRYNDGRNNYYIYNKGNITYSGVGDWENLSEGEVKLFTNTMIASYRAGDSALSIEVTDWDASTTETTAGNKTYDYVTLPVDYIKKAAGGAYGEGVVNNKSGTKTTQYRRVKFKVYDKTVAANKVVGIDFYTSSSKSDTQATVKLNYYASSIYRMSDGKVIMKNGSLVNGQKLESGTEYYIYVPLSDFNTKQIFRGEIKATIRPSGQTNAMVIKNSVYVNFNNRLQFNLG